MLTYSPSLLLPVLVETMFILWLLTSYLLPKVWVLFMAPFWRTQSSSPLDVMARLLLEEFERDGIRPLFIVFSFGLTCREECCCNSVFLLFFDEGLVPFALLSWVDLLLWLLVAPELFLLSLMTCLPEEAIESLPAPVLVCLNLFLLIESTTCLELLDMLLAEFDSPRPLARMISLRLWAWPRLFCC